MNSLGKANEGLRVPPVDPQEVGQARQIAGRYLRCVREVTHRPSTVVSRSDVLGRWSVVSCLTIEIGSMVT